MDEALQGYSRALKDKFLGGSSFAIGFFLLQRIVIHVVVLWTHHHVLVLVIIYWYKCVFQNIQILHFPQSPAWYSLVLSCIVKVWWYWRWPTGLLRLEADANLWARAAAIEPAAEKAKVAVAAYMKDLESTKEMASSYFNPRRDGSADEDYISCKTPTIPVHQKKRTSLPGHKSGGWQFGSSPTLPREDNGHTPPHSPPRHLGVLSCLAYNAFWQSNQRGMETVQDMEDNQQDQLLTAIIPSCASFLTGPHPRIDPEMWTSYADRNPVGFWRISLIRALVYLVPISNKKVEASMVIGGLDSWQSYIRLTKSGHRKAFSFECWALLLWIMFAQMPWWTQNRPCSVQRELLYLQVLPRNISIPIHPMYGVFTYIYPCKLPSFVGECTSPSECFG